MAKAGNELRIARDAKHNKKAFFSFIQKKRHEKEKGVQLLKAEARLAAKRAARAEAREIRMKELERQQKEIYQVQKKYYGLDTKFGDIEQWMEDSERYTHKSRRNTSASDEDERMSVGSRGSLRLECAVWLSCFCASKTSFVDLSLLNFFFVPCTIFKKKLLGEEEKFYKKGKFKNLNCPSTENSLFFCSVLQQSSFLNLLERVNAMEHF
ncbi:Leucine-rich repeat flightless-interacting protein 2 [Varanus komodoensis]|nr:Leucine-rich repeat flightless-interacting protein 2 [Varanus komodoensis]